MSIQKLRYFHLDLCGGQADRHCHLLSNKPCMVRNTMEWNYRVTWRLTFIVHKVFVFRPIFWLLEVDLPTFNVHFQERLCGNTKRFLFDLQVKMEGDQRKPKPPKVFFHFIFLQLQCNTITNLEKHLKRNNWYERIPMAPFISNGVKDSTFSLKINKEVPCHL